jgi:hypothetical protein
MFHTDGKPFDEFQTITTRRLNRRAVSDRPRQLFSAP